MPCAVVRRVLRGVASVAGGGGQSRVRVVPLAGLSTGLSLDECRAAAAELRGSLARDKACVRALIQEGAARLERAFAIADQGYR